MEIKINITQKNKEKVLGLISELVDSEYDKNAVVGSPEANPAQGSLVDLDLGIPKNVESITLDQPSLENSTIGSWFMFNSFFAGKALLRVLANYLTKENVSSMDTNQLIELSYKQFKSAGLSKYRGFPKDKKHHKYEKSNINKLNYFILVPFADMGFVTIDPSDKSDDVVLTKAGLDFLMLKNPILDENKQTPCLSEGEQRFIINYLKSVDEKYKEYSTLKDLFNLIKETNNISYTDIVNWFENNKKIIDYLYSGSMAEKEGANKDSKRFKDYLHHAAPSFASSRIALLRELGIIIDKRGEYKIISNLN